MIGRAYRGGRVGGLLRHLYGRAWGLPVVVSGTELHSRREVLVALDGRAQLAALGRPRAVSADLGTPGVPCTCHK